MLEPPERELELLIGLTFRLTSNDMAFTSDVMTNAGYVVPKNAQLTATTSLTDVMLEGLRLNFVNYLRRGLRAVRRKRASPGITRAAADRQREPAPDRGLSAPRPARGHARHRRTTSSCRATRCCGWRTCSASARGIFPTGGHCGSMDQREFVREMLRADLSTPEARS